MKKLFILMLSVVALVAFTSSAFALHGIGDMFEYTPSIVKSKKAQLNVSGHIRARGEIADNNSDFQDEDGGANIDDKASYDARVNLMIEATVSPNTKGVIELQSQKHSGNGDSDSYGWGSCTAAKGTYTNAGNCKPADVSIRQAYIATQWKGLVGQLSGAKIGHMPIALGNGQYYNHSEFGDDAIILWMQPMDNTEIAFAIIKGQEGPSNATADDVDIYALTFATVMDGFNLGADVSYLHDKDGVTFAPAELVELWNIGLRGDTSFGDVKVSIDGNIQTGTLDSFAADGSDVDLGGFAIEVKASTTVGSVGIHGGIGYGSGDDNDDDDYDGFITSLGNGQDYTYLYDQKAKTSAQTVTQTGGNSAYGNMSRTGLSNTTYFNLGASTNVNPDVKVSGDVYYLLASEEVSDTYNDDDIGVEVDTKVTYQIDTNFVWYLEAGYLFAGDFYKNITLGESPDDAYSVRHGVLLTF